jgi:class 3 adenylate cyclase
VTLLSTGVERSVLLWEMAPNAAVAALARHYEIIDTALGEHGAVRSGPTTDGDGVLAEFRTTYQAVAAALAIQRAFAAEEWPDGLPIRVRIGLYTSEVREPDRTGVTAHRCTRLRDIAHGGQTLLSAATASLAADARTRPGWPTSGSTGCATCRAPSTCTRCAIPASRRTSRRCVRSTSSPTTCRRS